MVKTKIPGFDLKEAQPADVPVILSFIRQLGEYERLPHEVVATEEILQENLFGSRRVAEVILGFYNGEPVGFALFFHSFSTFLGRPGIYLEDLYVKPEMRRKGLGQAMLSYVAKVAKERHCGRFEWSVLDWNEPAIEFYRKLGATPMADWTVWRIAGDPLDHLASRFEEAGLGGR